MTSLACLMFCKSQNGMQLKFFSVDQNVGVSLKSFVTKTEISAPFCFQDIAVQN